ncbi:hypothetical protein NDU88_000012 [Pleurodeles waltl]|uniref:Uncharacterized protein n=1 Tax=Pleurodeles waltl TaxID=8319 RepID=A0AAV7KVP6_PLEWA|nr:hypothetical protein NDU88_000012 [Pleurodeles waltl]
MALPGWRQQSQHQQRMGDITSAPPSVPGIGGRSRLCVPSPFIFSPQRPLQPQEEERSPDMSAQGLGHRRKAEKSIFLLSRLKD